MKKLLVSLVAVVALAVVGVGVAEARLSPSYRAVYCYPTGSYWQAQIAAYPDYYASMNRYFVRNYGARTQYCR